MISFNKLKAAIQTGILALCEKAEIDLLQIDEITITGALGRDINIQNSQLIGLIPKIDQERISVIENGALSGCSKLLFSLENHNIINNIREKAEVINLANWEKFESVYMDALYFRSFPK